MKFGAHVGMAGGVSNSIKNCMDIGGNSFALFLKSPRRWESPPYSKEEIETFHNLCKEYNYNPRTDILPHGSYFINLANPDQEKELKAYDSFLDDLKRCELLNIGLYNFHPGSDLGSDHTTALKKLASNINKAIKETNFVKIVIENMAGHGNLIGSDLNDIKFVIDLIEDKSRVGVCIDTCHSFAAGYDLRTEETYKEFWDKFDEIIGRKYLASVHLNDSKAPIGANRDLHAKLGYGFLGLETFRLIANDENLQNIPIVLETPVDKGNESEYGDEIKLLEWLIGKSKDDSEFKEKSAKLSKLGESERKDQLAKYEKKVTKKRKSENDILSALKKNNKKSK
ncbi:hypothetical protein PACTADRAFT_51852 [Pachysolen tannophilus NRRL Y-2460]|uniref:Apurinic-apyrimidinic endonuclease 1 n=1 Tax=Pachysolen tannophilus NRRL Y-2460 TaxID=669874 RepID=A0A1E4TN97_PACTA|nr:hypothetical protein PACTADRAFT_51852 [Pachysolen tannophilus NRRL Y-2460]